MSSTPEQLRKAADILARAIDLEGGGVCDATNIVHEAEQLFEDTKGRALPGMEMYLDGIGLVGKWRDHYYDPEGWCWLAGAAWLRLMVEALYAEQSARAERVGSGYRDCIRDGVCAGCGAPIGELHRGTCDWEHCGKCHDQRMSCGCDQDEQTALLEEFMGESRP